MTESPQITNPSITLYSFHLRNDGDEGYQQPAQNAAQVWNNLADNVGNKFNFPELKSLREKLICYQNGQYYPAAENNSTDQQFLLSDGKTLRFQALTHPNNLKLKGSIAARRIHDTYTADLTFYYQNATIPTTDLKQLNPDNCLLPDRIQASLGQTLLLYAEPEGTYDDNDYRGIAGECVRALVGNEIAATLNLTGKGKLFGSPIFEYNNLAKKCHILVWLKQHPQTLNLVTSDFNYYLINLLCSRSKVLFVFDRAKESYRLGQQTARNLEQQRTEFTQIEAESNRETKLANLKRLLAKINNFVFDYADELRYLQEFSNTVEINATNYGANYTRIKRMSAAEDDLEFLRKFRVLCDRKYQSQIQKYLNYLVANQNLFQQTISTIRGLVEIEQAELSREQAEREHQRDRAQIQLYQQKEEDEKKRDRQQMELYKKNEDKEKKRDRQLENIIFFVGTAIGGGQIFSAAYPLLKDSPIKWQLDFSLPLHPFAATILWSLLFGLVFGWLMLGVAVLVRKIFLR